MNGPLDNDDSNNDSMLRPNQDSLLEDGTGSEYACSPVASSGGIGGVLRLGHIGLGGLCNNHDVMDEDDDTKGQLISECPFGDFKSTKKTNEIFVRISTLASKKRTNQKK